MFRTPHFESHSTTDPWMEILSTVQKQEIEFHMIEEMYAELRMCTCEEKATFLGKDD